MVLIFQQDKQKAGFHCPAFLLKSMQDQ